LKYFIAERREPQRAGTPMKSFDKAFEDDIGDRGSKAELEKAARYLIDESRRSENL
jgi:hypothetical protein